MKKHETLPGYLISGPRLEPGPTRHDNHSTVTLDTTRRAVYVWGAVLRHSGNKEARQQMGRGTPPIHTRIHYNNITLTRQPAPT